MALTGTADQFINGKLVAAKQTNIYGHPGSNTAIAIVKSGAMIGTIISYVTYNGNVWWQVEPNSKGGHSGFVQHIEGQFDQDALTQSLLEYATQRQKEIDDAAQARIDANDPFSNVASKIGDLFSGIGKYLLIGGGIIVGLIIITRK